MGTNYYLMHKKDNKLAVELWDARNTAIANTNFVELIEPEVLKAFTEPLKVAKSNKLDNVIERFKDDLHEAIQQFVSGLEYNISYTFDIREHRAVHIGKSSMGWLFNFQDQDTELAGVHIKWHSYEDVMSFLEEWVKVKKEFVIVDEYDEEMPYEEFKDFVDVKQADPHNLENPDNFTYCRNVNGYRFSEGDFS